MTRSERPHRVVVAILFVVATICGFVALFSIWANRQALNTDNWTDTSGRLLENKNIQKAVSGYLVDQLFSNVDVAGDLQKILPQQLDVIAGPASGAIQELANREAPVLLANPKVQEAWRAANRAAHEQLLNVLDNKGDVVTTGNGEVTLNLHPLVDQLAQRLGLQSQVASVREQLQGGAGDTARNVAQQRLGVTLPDATGKLVIMRSNELKTAQDVANGIRHLAVISTVLMLLLFAIAVALASGWRRIALRTTGWCFFGVGLLVLLGRRVGGGRIVDALVSADSVRPAANSAWAIGTDLLRDIALATVFYGIVFILAAWLAGSTRPAYALREAMAPAFRHHLASAYGVVAILFLLFLAWGPTPASRKPLGILLFAALLVLGIEVLRRQMAREFPDAETGDTWERIKGWFSGARTKVGEKRASSKSTPSSGSAGRYDELEQLASLRDRGVLTDEEFASQKTLILEAR